MKALNDDYENSFRPLISEFLARVDYGHVSKILSDGTNRLRAMTRSIIEKEIRKMMDRTDR